MLFRPCATGAPSRRWRRRGATWVAMPRQHLHAPRSRCRWARGHERGSSRTGHVHERVNTILWAAVLRARAPQYPREEVDRDLAVALESIKGNQLPVARRRRRARAVQLLIPAYACASTTRRATWTPSAKLARRHDGRATTRAPSDTASPVAQSATPGSRQALPSPPSAGPRLPTGRRVAARAFVASAPARLRRLRGSAVARQRPLSGGTPRSSSGTSTPAVAARGVGVKDAYPAPARRRRSAPPPSPNAAAARAGFDANGLRRRCPCPAASSTLATRPQARRRRSRAAAAAGGAGALPELWSSAAWTDYLHRPVGATPRRSRAAATGAARQRRQPSPMSAGGEDEDLAG